MLFNELVRGGYVVLVEFPVFNCPPFGRFSVGFAVLCESSGDADEIKDVDVEVPDCFEPKTKSFCVTWLPVPDSMKYVPVGKLPVRIWSAVSFAPVPDWM